MWFLIWECSAAVGIKMNKFTYINQVFLNLTIRDFKLKYKGSMLGVFWAFINPLVLSFVLCFVFKTIVRVQVPNYELFVLSVVFNWYCFSLCFSEAPYSLISQASILKQFNVPVYVFVLSFVSANYLNFLLGWIFIFLFFVYKGTTSFAFLPLALLFVFLQFIFTFAICFIAAVANALKRDTAKFAEIVMMVWFWFTPVFYSTGMIPVKYRSIVYLNPMNYYIQAIRDIILNGKVPSFEIAAGAFWFAGLFMGLMYIAFRITRNKIVKRI